MSYVLTHGFGDVKTPQYIGQGGSLAAAGATALVGSIAASGGTVLGIAASSLIPVVGPIIAGVTFGIQALVANSGCGQTCIETSQWANQAEAALKKNLAAYLALPVPRPKSAQVVGVANFNTIWHTLEAQCGQPGTGNAGVRCISDRQAGACKWKDASGQCFNWFSGYLDPIANDPNVYDDSIAAEVSGAASSLFSSSGSVQSSSLLLPLLLAGLIGVAVLS